MARRKLKKDPYKSPLKMQKNSRAYTIYLIYNIASAGIFALVFTVSSVYYVVTAGLDPLQLVLVGTMLEVAIFLFEVPTGVVADIYSRRLSVIIGVFLIGVGFILEGSLPIFLAILLAQLLWGAGYTFTSGAVQAWISDEIGEAQAGPAFLRGAQLSQFGAITGTAAGTALGTVALNLPIVLGGVLFLVLGGFLLIFMPETGFQPAATSDRSTFGNMLHTLKSGAAIVRNRPILANILWIGIFFGLYSEGFDRLWVAFMLEGFNFPLFEPVVWIGVMRGTAMLLIVAAAEIVRRRVDTNKPNQIGRVMAILTVGLVGCLLAFALSRELALAIALYLAISIFREINYPLYTAWVNHRLEPQVRATVLSFSSQIDAIGQIAGGPAIGVLARTVSLRAGLIGSGILLSPVLWLFAIVLRKPENEVAIKESRPPSGSIDPAEPPGE
jgi:MFS transporter, DHA3 family, tetracycline resistance protein